MASHSPLEEQLKTLKITDVSEYSLAGKKFIGKVVDVYDGDTCKIIFLQDGNFIRYTCRLLGIDTPEMKSKTDQAYNARNRLIQLATNIPIDLANKSTHSAITKQCHANTKLVNVECYDFDKYGRLLIKLSCIDNPVCFSDIMIAEKLANSYDGGTKQVFADS